MAVATSTQTQLRDAYKALNKAEYAMRQYADGSAQPAHAGHTPVATVEALLLDAVDKINVVMPPGP